MGAQDDEAAVYVKGSLGWILLILETGKGCKPAGVYINQDT